MNSRDSLQECTRSERDSLICVRFHLYQHIRLERPSSSRQALTFQGRNYCTINSRDYCRMHSRRRQEGSYAPSSAAAAAPRAPDCPRPHCVSPQSPEGRSARTGQSETVRAQKKISPPTRRRGEVKFEVAKLGARALNEAWEENRKRKKREKKWNRQKTQLLRSAAAQPCSTTQQRKKE